MKTVLDPGTRQELEARAGALTPGHAARWGRMDATRMLAHCSQGLRMATGDLVLRHSPARLIGWMFKALATNDRPFQRNAPTAPELKVPEPAAFEAERDRFLATLATVADGLAVRVHPFFGRLDREQWGKLVYKHVDHHFQQFGV
ncbi:MAG TPA: DUF1569 domain-containing protein [Holophaga sp.]|nr:DUF1569 domain-containing protein [Holophaga sp.]